MPKMIGAGFELIDRRSYGGDPMDDMSADGVMRFATAVKGALGSHALAHTSDEQFTAMVCLATDIGVGQFKASSVLARHKEGKFAAAAEAFLLWGEMVGKPDMRDRRREEINLYLSGGTHE